MLKREKTYRMDSPLVPPTMLDMEVEPSKKEGVCRFDAMEHLSGKPKGWNTSKSSHYLDSHPRSLSAPHVSRPSKGSWLWGRVTLEYIEIWWCAHASTRKQQEFLQCLSFLHFYVYIDTCLWEFYTWVPEYIYIYIRVYIYMHMQSSRKKNSFYCSYIYISTYRYVYVHIYVH